MVRKIYNTAFRLSYQSNWVTLENSYNNSLSINQIKKLSKNSYSILFSLLGFSTNLIKLKITSKAIKKYYLNKQLFINQIFFQDTLKPIELENNLFHYRQKS